MSDLFKNVPKREPGSKKWGIMPEGKEITGDEFIAILIQYCADEQEFRQIYNKNEFLGEMKIWWLYDFNIGVAIWHYPKGLKWENKFFRVGKDESWKEFFNDFAEQFRGDNS
jgi:hypothetical protein